MIAMFDKAEAEFKALQEKRRIVLNDRSKIESVIRELDEKKKEALRVTWTKVNADFGSIFSTLLPSTSAKLEPPEGESFLAGLEVKVAFGGVWKESLTELSGGQRSLLALSLILALLLFKPAPIYILDEVDAALDLSHTQNIGRMIRAHFPYSQFIVVSLKEGMFNNANCIFRTEFVDGVSTVTRTVPALKAADPNADKEKGPGVSDAAQKDAGKVRRTARRTSRRRREKRGEDAASLPGTGTGNVPGGLGNTTASAATVRRTPRRGAEGCLESAECATRRRRSRAMTGGGCDRLRPCTHERVS